MKRIVFINPGQFGYKAGYYYYCKYLVKDKKYNVSFICFDQNLPKLEIPFVDVTYIDFSGNSIKRHLRWLQSLYHIIKGSKFKDTIFFMVYFKLCFLFPLLFPKKLKVLDIRTGSVSTNSKLNWLQNQQFKLESLFFKNITILSKGLVKHIGLQSNKCHWLPLGSEVLSSEDKCFNSFKLIYVGSLNNRQIHDSIEGLKLFLEKIDGINLEVSYDIFGFGSVKQIEFLEHIIIFNGLGGIVNFHGRKNHIELKPFFNKCNIGVSYIPKRKYYEYQPATKTFEYILAGMVCIATGTYENKLVISDENGVLCDDNKFSFAEALNLIYIRRHNYASKSIRDSLPNYTWEWIINNNLKPYFDIVISTNFNGKYNS